MKKQQIKVFNFVKCHLSINKTKEHWNESDMVYSLLYPWGSSKLWIEMWQFRKASR